MAGKPSVELATLVAFLDSYLEIGEVDDYGPNGLQVEGRSAVSRVVTGVSACADLFAAAREREADAVVVHHGLFWEGAPRTLTGIQMRRVAALIQGGLSLLAYHLPLDRHAKIGNNAVAARQLELVDSRPFGDLRGSSIGVVGRFETPRSRSAVVEQLAELYLQDPLVFGFGTDEISTVAIVSGGGSRFLECAVDDQVDLFVTGEAEEWTMNQARELGMNFVAAGHHATERLGVQELGSLVKRRFGIAADFVDIPNPV